MKALLIVVALAAALGACARHSTDWGAVSKGVKHVVEDERQ